jgi:hypothetical protein
MKMARSKSEFEWKSQQQIGVVDVNEKKRNLISFCSLDITDQETDEVEEKWYISIQTLQFYQAKTKGDTEPVWHISKNSTFPLDTWCEIVDLVNANIEFE